MTEIAIRNGILKSISSDFTITAWDATVNTQFTWTTSGSLTYTFWSDYEMSGTKNMRTTYSAYELGTFLPNLFDPMEVYDTETLLYPLMDFSCVSCVTYSGTSDIFSSVYNARVYMAVMRVPLLPDTKQFILSVGRANTIGGNPLWTYADLHIYKDAINNHDHLISRVGTSYKSSRITNFNTSDVHVYALIFDGTRYYVWLDNQLITSHDAISTGGAWASNNWGSINTMWVGGWYGYTNSIDVFSMNTENIGIHAITHVSYDDIGLQSGSAFPLAVNELCHYRYRLPSPPDTSHNSTATTTLTSTQIIIFGSYNFDDTQQFL